MKLPIGISDFKKLIEANYQFADKTLFIKDIIDDGAGVILITRPRRFGKTLNMSMLNYFLNQNQKDKPNLFENLEIAKDGEFCETHQNKYPVIFVSFKDIKEASYQNTFYAMSSLISSVYSQHRYLLEGGALYEDEKSRFNRILNNQADTTELQNSLQRLSEYLNRYFGVPVIVLMDEYDTPIQEAYFRGYYAELVPFMRGLLGQLLKDNSNVNKAILTGITRVSQESLFSGLNHLRVYTLLNEKYGQYFGFTEDEVVRLIDKTGYEVSINSIKEWYNGYQVGKYILYNPWSIINCLSNDGRLEPYWLNTASNELIATLLSKADPSVKYKFEELLQGKVITQSLMVNLVFTDLEKREEALWSLLLYAGYLKVLSSEVLESRFVAQIAIPNREVSFAYHKIVEDWFSTAINLESYDRFIKTIIDGDIDRFKAYIGAYIMQSGSYFDFNANTPEQIFHAFILGMVVGLRKTYIIQSNAETGFGRCDVMLIPKDSSKQAILLEFKTAKAPELLLDRANEGLEQIKDKSYIEILHQHHIKSATAIGLAFCGKEVEMAHEKIDLSEK